MKAIYSPITARHRAKRVSTSLVTAAAVICLVPQAMAATTAVPLGSTSSFAVLAGAGITFTGAVGSIPIRGDIGTFPTTSITGITSVVLTGTNQAGNSVTQLAKTDLVTAFVNAAGRPADISYGPIAELGGRTLSSGVYNGSSSFGITGNLTLDALGDPNAVWIFQSGTGLTANSGSKVILAGGAKAANVFWQVGSSATIDTGSQFVGTVLALTSITVATGASVDGRLLARNGTVTMAAGTSVVPEPAGSLLAGAGLVALLARRRRSLAAV